MKRGIIASPNKTVRTSIDGVSFTPNITMQDFYYYILYWDKVVMPTNNIIHQGIPHEELLINEGILERPRIAFTSWNTTSSPDIIVESQKIVTNDFIKNRKDVDWTLHQIGDEIILGDGMSKEFHSIRVDLNQCLPVPLETTRIEDILNFKLNRDAELSELHNALDNFYIEILNSPDRTFQTRRSLAEVKNAIENLNIVSQEKFTTASKYNIVTELNINVSSLFVGAKIGEYFQNFIDPQFQPLTTVAGALLSMISLKLNKTTSVEAATEKVKLNYLSNAKEAGIIY